MTNPTRAWNLVPIWGAYFKGDGVTPIAGTIKLTFTQRVTRVDGRMIYPEGHTIERAIGNTDADPATRDAVRAAFLAADQAAAAAAGETFDQEKWDAWWTVWLTGAVFAGFPASDDPDIVERGYQVLVEERLSSSSGKVYYLEPLLAHLELSPPGINLGQFAVPPGAPSAPAPVYAKGLAGGVAALDGDGDVVDAFGEKVKGGGGAGAVSSVNGVEPDETGEVTLNPSNIGAQPAGSYATTKALNDGLLSRLPTSDPSVTNARPPLAHQHDLADIPAMEQALADAVSSKADLVDGIVTEDQLPEGLARTTEVTEAITAAVAALPADEGLQETFLPRAEYAAGGGLTLTPDPDHPGLYLIGA